jgi:L-lactate dehydrogenase (cytochrome)
MPTRRLPRLSELAPLLRPRPPELSITGRRLATVASIADLARVARRRAPRAVFDYTDGAAGNETTLARMRDTYRRVEFYPRVLQDVSSIDTTTTILGRHSALPLILAPTGFTRMMHTEGELAVGRVAARAGIPYALSTMGTTSIEALAEKTPNASLWFQLYLWRDRGAGRDFVERALAARYDTLVLTVDTPVAGPRLRDVRNGLTIPPSLSLATIADGAIHPRWWFDLLTTEPLQFASLTRFDGTVAELIGSMFDPGATIADVSWLREIWPGSLVIKGIQHRADALAVVDAGADGIVVSNHGGRQLDRAPVPLEQLPTILDAVGDRAEVYLDGGIMTGGDIVAAVALGARAALVGRAYLYGLMAGGEQGVEKAVTILGSEIRSTMALLGVASVSELGPHHVRLRDSTESLPPPATPGSLGGLGTARS